MPFCSGVAPGTLLTLNSTCILKSLYVFGVMRLSQSGDAVRMLSLKVQLFLNFLFSGMRMWPLLPTSWMASWLRLRLSAFFVRPAAD